MNSMMRILAAVACAAVLTTACSKPATDQAAPPVVGVRVTGMDLGRSLAADKAIADKTEAFRPADMIYLSVETDGTSPKTTVAAHWTFQDGQVVKEQSETIAPAGKARTEFHIEKPGGWPAGKYAVKVSLDGTAAGGKDFVVK